MHNSNDNSSKTSSAIGVCTNNGGTAMEKSIQIMVATLCVVALTVGFAKPANADTASCKRTCNTSSVTEDELQTCLKKCGGGNVASTDTGKKHRGGGNVAKAVPTWCPSANDGAGGELVLAKGENCPACPDGSTSSQGDQPNCEKPCGPAFGQMFPIANFAKTCPSCESRGMKTAKDGSCFKEQVIAAPSTSTCTDCNTCNHWCWSWWDLLLLVFILVLTIVFRNVMNKEGARLLKEFDERGKKLLSEINDLLLKDKITKPDVEKLIGEKVGGLLKNTVSQTELDALPFITRAQLPGVLKLDRRAAAKERELEASLKARKRLEADSDELDKREAELKKLEDAATKAATELSEIEAEKAGMVDKFMSIDTGNPAAVSAFNAEKLDLFSKLETAKAKAKAACESRDSALKAAKAERDELVKEFKSETEKYERLEGELAALNEELQTGAPPLPRT